MQDKNLMITGSPAKRIVAFALPLMLGNFFQQLYNTADSLIVGNFLGSTALAAVSSAGNLIFLMIGFFQGVSAGAGVVIAHFLGARELERTRKAVHTTVAIGLIAGLFLMIFGVIATPWMLRMMHTPENVMPDSVAYFRNFFYGAVGVVMYNTFVGILQASGDSKHPLYFLIISSITNVVMDLVFIVVLGMGAGGAGLATAISSLLSACLCLRRLVFSGGEVTVHLGEIGIDPKSLRRILYNGLPSGLQNSIIAISNVLIQSSINSLGADMMSGMGTYAKIEGFA
ncbi:MAG: MATE family efflux transporter, partial [Lachnospiraceae bacterium]|nr:MATE family efflux transporter [Lachnospiraceae bacterium]